MAKIHLTIRGIAPIIIQSDRLVDPLDDITKAIKELTGKRRKSDDDHRKIGEHEFVGSLYYDEALGPFIPGDNLHACLRQGGTLSRQGTDVNRAVVVLSDMMPIEYPGPRTRQELWDHGGFAFRRSVVVKRARTMRTRPRFNKWSIEADVELATDIMNIDAFRRVAEDAGRLCGLGTWRPRYGRFDVKVG